MRLRTILHTTVPLGATVMLTLSIQSPGCAIPAFARKYHTTCARCHSEVPRLNNYGWNFKLRGYHVPGDEDVGKITTSEDKSLSLLDQLPLALRLLGNATSTTAPPRASTFTLDSEIDLLSAGTLARRIGYWAEIDTIKNGDGSYSPNIPEIRAMFTDLVKRDPTALNLEVGKFTLDEFGISTARILTQNPYAIYDLGIGGFAEGDEVQGFNLYGAIGTGIGKGVAAVEQKTGTAATVTEEEKKALDAELNQQAAKPAQDTPEMMTARAVLDALVKKGTLTQEDADKTLSELGEKLGPPPPATPMEPAPSAQPVSLAKSDYDVRKGLFYQAGLVTRGTTTSNNSNPQGYARLIYADPRDMWVGPVAYFGSNNLANPNSTIMVPLPNFTNHFSRYDLEAGYSFGPHRDVAGVARKAVELLVAGQYGSDSNVDGSGTLIRHSGGFAEASYLFDDQNLAVLRWDRVTSSQMPGIDVNTLTLNYTRYVRRNIKVGLEFVPDFMGNSPNHLHSNQFSIFYDITL